MLLRALKNFRNFLHFLDLFTIIRFGRNTAALEKMTKLLIEQLLSFAKSYAGAVRTRSLRIRYNLLSELNTSCRLGVVNDPLPTLTREIPSCMFAPYADYICRTV